RYLHLSHRTVGCCISKKILCKPLNALAVTYKITITKNRMIGRKENDQGLGPKGKMIEGRSGGSGRGTRRELWAPPDSGSAHRRIAGLYRVRLSTRSRSLRRPRISSPPPLPHPSHLPAGPREKFRRTQAHVQLGTRLRRMAGPKGK